ncbi:MAG TPA: hypothetical protein VFO63_03515 [Blastocatellia bacterium]|nr:hypothetical protein [Blastocatellia bacterium]
MCKIQITRLLAGFFMALALGATALAQSSGSQSSDERENRPVKSQARGLIERDIMARAEERAESLRTRLFEVQMQELDLQNQLDYLDFRLTPDSIQRALAFTGSARPMDELRDGLRARLENEKERVNKRLEFLTASRERLEAEIRRADAEVERIRQRSNSE